MALARLPELESLAVELRFYEEDDLELTDVQQEIWVLQTLLLAPPSPASTVSNCASMKILVAPMKV